MNRQQKELVVQLLRERFSQSPASFVVGYKGLNVGQMEKLRSMLRQTGGVFKIAKTRLMKLALIDSKQQSLMPYLKDQIGVVFVVNEPSVVAKVLNEFAQRNGALQLLGGMLDSELIDESAITRIASLPSKEVLLAILCGTLNAPTSRLVFVLKMQIIPLLLVLKRVAEKKK